ncbi:MAG: MBL fold metallo-hydrolase, partial [Lachnospiraceae bacterium]|nr:MBL fold metallo-hydrolase [Lachnospiraceae bacterium]
MSHEIHITVLIENTATGTLTCEHGLSLLIQYADKRILLDAGSTNAFCQNADAMGVSLTDLDAYVLSHGHYDHSGGFEELF